MKTNKLLGSLIAMFAGIILFVPNSALAAAFGVSPPWIENENMKPGSSFVYVINLSANELSEDMLVQSKFEGDAEISEWLEVQNKDNIVMSKGKSIVPMSVNVNIPENAELGKYSGKLKISLTSKTGQTENIAVLLGGNVEVDLTVIDHDITDYWIQSIGADPINEGQAVNLKMSLKNLGNTNIDEVSTKATIIDMKTAEKIASGSVEKLSVPVYPHTMGNAELTFPVDGLKAGSYWLDVESFKDGVSVYETRLNLSVSPSSVNSAVFTGVEVSEDGKARPAAISEDDQGANVQTSVRVRTPLTNQLIVVIIGLLVVLLGVITKIYTVLKKKRR